MSERVNLLLLLSALLSALSGNGVSGRAPQMPVVAARAAEAAIVEAARPRRASRPTVVAPKLPVPLDVATLALVVPISVPLYLSRRRE